MQNNIFEEKDNVSSLLNFLKIYQYHFFDENEINIKLSIDELFPVLNIQDKNMLYLVGSFVIDIISNKFHFIKEKEYYEQWNLNNGKDIKGVILMLLPFINTSNESILFKELVDLNHILYSCDDAKISYDFKYVDKSQVLKKYFKFSNMALSLLDISSDNLLELYQNKQKLIYIIIYHNLLSTLQTLEIINGKLYINWINIVPIVNYKESKIYQATKLLFNNFSFELDLNYNGLWLGDIYNILRNKYYEQSKNIKWLIFPYEYNNEKKYLIQGLNKLVNLNNIINNINVDFTKTLNDAYELLLNNYDYVNYEIIKYLLIYFINNNEINNFDIFKLDNTEDDSKEEDYKIEIIQNISNITNDDILNCFNYVINNHSNELFLYLQSVIEELKITPYAKYLLKEQSINDTYYYYDTSTELNLKNIYNISKSLSHTKEWYELNQNYLALTDDNKDIFFNNILINTNWLNIKQNIFRQKGNYNNYENIKTQLISEFKENFINIVFDSLEHDGLLNEIIPDLELSINTNRKLRQKKLEKKFNKNKDQWLECNYYLTNDKFKNLKKIRYEDNKKMDAVTRYVETDYFKLITEDHEWPFYYAMDWISQINFFKHYIYNQIMYVTGATGQGKSTQVPKLLLYALKMIDYKKNGKVVCTQPRVNPVVENATRIAEEFGLPIEQVSKSLNFTTKIKTNNYYVEYKHQKENHINTIKKYNSLKLVTDGSLLNEIKKNNTMREVYDNRYINKNIYDIVIVDEAHEHGMNMDIIIALMRQICYFNNQVRLIIVSATMDDDDPVYRQYFKYNKDKYLFPCKQPIKYPFMYKEMHIKPTYLDRRYDISPPNETTQYKVMDKYYKNIFENNINLTEEEKSELTLIECFKKIIEICNTSNKGNILLFTTGTPQIKKAVKYLNENTKPDIVVLPYYGEMNELYKPIIAKIDKKINTIKNKKENIINDWFNENYIEDNDVPSGIYKRAVIVATNVAEASVTIPELLYVVDNGYAKVNVFDDISQITKLDTQKISEYSRIQRRGRVGRRYDGFVHYMYSKGARADVKPKYGITQNNFTRTFLELLKEENDNTPIIENQYLLLLLKKNLEKSFVEFNNKLAINKMTITIFKFYDTGQSTSTILDNKGEFYLIHPFENNIKRNILNDIISYKNIEFKIDNVIPFDEYKYILTFSLNYNLLIDTTLSNNYNENMNIIKTKFTKEVLDYISNESLEVSYSINDGIIFLLAKKNNYFIPISEIIIFLKIIKENIGNLFFNSKSIKLVKSEILLVYNIINNFKEHFKNMFIFNINNIKNNINDECQNILDDFIEKYNNDIEPTNNYKYSMKLWNELVNLKNNNKLDKNSKGIKKISKQIIYNNFTNYEKKIRKWCEYNFINYDIIDKYCNSKELFDLYNDNIELHNYIDEDKIMNIFLYSKYTQIIKNNNWILNDHNFKINKDKKSLIIDNGNLYFYKYEANENNTLSCVILSQVNKKIQKSNYITLFM